MRYFQTKFLEEANQFLGQLHLKAVKKVFYNIDKAEQINDSTLFKKIHPEIWEFRTEYFGQEIRLLAFWDKDDKSKTLVIATSGFIKKSKKTPKNEIEKALNIKLNYFDHK
ncbi:MAG: type II toxin-antitoxin system RelE/ParE family toxin [Saprospiraceae bacterium]|nr:type II toxin-antitoxin system RelE/ParE family toxin [Saprospiraceae bacterium]MBK9631002.1 type II toxin-antitoxin system RelE/ParE family toxin [Saprospiraceae bacterium]